MSKVKITSEELGKSLFDFVVVSSHKFLENFENLNTLKMSTKVKKEEINQRELIIAYLWLVFHFLNVAGKKYEETTIHMHSSYANFLNLSKEDTALAMKHVQERYNQYKSDFQLIKVADFQKIGMSVAENILGKITIDFTFPFSIGISLGISAKELMKLLKEIDLIEKK